MSLLPEVTYCTFIYELILSRMYESWLCCQKRCRVQMRLILQAVKYLLHTLSTLC